MSALGPMAGPPPDQLPLPPGMDGGGGPPPDLSALLGGAGPPPGGDPNAGAPPPPGGDGGEEAENAALKRAAAALQDAMDAETDPADDAELTKLLAAIKKMLANREDEKHAAMGSSPALKLAMRQSRAQQ